MLEPLAPSLEEAERRLAAGTFSLSHFPEHLMDGQVVPPPPIPPSPPLPPRPPPSDIAARYAALYPHVTPPPPPEPVLGPFEYTVPSHWIAPTNDKGPVRGFIAWLRPCKPESNSNTFGRLLFFIVILTPLVLLMGPAIAVVLLFWWTAWVIVRVCTNVNHQKKVLQRRREQVSYDAYYRNRA